MNIRQTIFLLLLHFIPISALPQKIGAEYRTAIDSVYSLHYLIFEENGTIEIVFPRSPGVYWDSQSKQKLSYSRNQDTLFFHARIDTTMDCGPVIARLENSISVVTRNKEILEIENRYIYVNNRLVHRKNLDKTTVSSFEGKLYKSRGLSKMLLRRRVKDIDVEDYDIHILRGNEAQMKYGVMGINGVIEIEKSE